MPDYQNIINELKDEDVFHLLVELGAEPIDKGSFFLCRTICHHTDDEEKNYKLYYYKNTHIFYCYSEDGAMSIFKFLKQYYETRQIEYNWFEDIYSVVVNCSNFQKIEEGFNIKKYSSIRENYQQKKSIILPEYSSVVLDTFIKYYPPEWLNDGISKEAIDKFNILYSISQNKIIIPHYDVNNRLVGIRGRALDPWEVENVGKYAPIKVENIWYKHPLSLNLYGLNFTKNNIKKSGVCFLCESEKAVLQAESFSRPNCFAAVCGSNLNKFALHILIKECQPKEVVICFDNEEKSGEDKYFFKLWNLCKRYNNISNFSFIYDRENLLNLKDSPTDRGEEVFEQLLKRRVIVK